METLIPPCCLQYKSRLFLLVLFVVIIGLALISQQRVRGWNIRPEPRMMQPIIVQNFTVQPLMAFTYNPPALHLKCPKVLDRMVVGHWVKRAHTTAELDEVQRFLNETRDFHHLPSSLQRSDKKCGNVNFPGLQWHRAVCNPFGREPCCYNNQCVSKSEEECRCPQCYDMRQQINAELFTWVPSDPTCQIIDFAGEQDTCQVLSGLTIYFIGDSFMRQLFISVLSLLRSNKKHGALIDTLPAAELSKCDKYYRFFSKCGAAVMSSSMECNNTVYLKRQAYWKTGQASDILKMMGELSGKPNSFIVFDLGIHDMFNVDAITQKIFNPVFNLLSKSPWPRLIWMATHATGLLKTPLVPKQQPKSVLAYNAKVKTIMDKRGIPIMDFFQMTNGTMSYDGTHYGKGVNDVKAKIFLNYILEMRSNSTLFSGLNHVNETNGTAKT